MEGPSVIEDADVARLEIPVDPVVRVQKVDP